MSSEAILVVPLLAVFALPVLAVAAGAVLLAWGVGTVVGAVAEASSECSATRMDQRRDALRSQRRERTRAGGSANARGAALTDAHRAAARARSEAEERAHKAAARRQLVSERRASAEQAARAATAEAQRLEVTAKERVARAEELRMANRQRAAKIEELREAASHAADAAASAASETALRELEQAQSAATTAMEEALAAAQASSAAASSATLRATTQAESAAALAAELEDVSEQAARLAGEARAAATQYSEQVSSVIASRAAQAATAAADFARQVDVQMESAGRRIASQQIDVAEAALSKVGPTAASQNLAALLASLRRANADGTMAPKDVGARAHQVLARAHSLGREPGASAEAEPSQTHDTAAAHVTAVRQRINQLSGRSDLPTAEWEERLGAAAALSDPSQQASTLGALAADIEDEVNWRDSDSMISAISEVAESIALHAQVILEVRGALPTREEQVALNTNPPEEINRILDLCDHAAKQGTRAQEVLANAEPRLETLREIDADIRDTYDAVQALLDDVQRMAMMRGNIERMRAQLEAQGYATYELDGGVHGPVVVRSKRDQHLGVKFSVTGVDGAGDGLVKGTAVRIDDGDGVSQDALDVHSQQDICGIMSDAAHAIGASEEIHQPEWPNVLEVVNLEAASAPGSPTTRSHSHGDADQNGVAGE